MITAKIQCQSKLETGDGDKRQTALTFVPDYTDGRNAEWALYTPGLALTMTVKGIVGDRFEQGKAYTLTFEESDDQPGA